MLSIRFRQWLAVVVVVAVTLFSGYYSFFIRPFRVLVRDDGVTKWEERMKPVRAYLPATIREVGYISDNDSTAMIQEYSLTRYALAPIVVRQSTNYEWIIGNFTQPGFEEILNQQIHSSYSIKKFNAGIYLIHRTLP